MVFKSKLIIHGQKECADCKQWKPVEHYSVRGHSTKGKPYLNSCCTLCMSARAKQWQQANLTKHVPYQVLYKIKRLKGSVPVEQWTEVREALLDELATRLGPGGDLH
jgi:hypothetical protein